MTNLYYDLENEKVQYLIRTEKKLGILIKYIGRSEIKLENDGFKCLVKYIIGQQISDKARETIWQRLSNTYKNITPEMILSIKDQELKQIGLSERKVTYIKILASAVMNNYINFSEFKKLTNEEIIKKLTSLKGIGRWTAEMYLIFSLGRENVLSKGDGTIKRTIKWMYNLETLPSSEQLIKYFDKWAQYSTIVSSYLWKSIELGLTQKPFENIINKVR